MAPVASLNIDTFSDNLFFASDDEHSVSFHIVRPADTAIDNNNIIIHTYLTHCTNVSSLLE